MLLLRIPLLDFFDELEIRSAGVVVIDVDVVVELAVDVEDIDELCDDVLLLLLFEADLLLKLLLKKL